MNESRVAFLADYAEAWNAHDIDRIMAMMTRDCVFLPGGGPEAWGTRIEGAEAVRRRFIEVWTHFPDATWLRASHVAHGDRGFSEWLFTGTDPGGRLVELYGCDLFTFRDGLIATKDTYLKARE